MNSAIGERIGNLIGARADAPHVAAMPGMSMTEYKITGSLPAVFLGITAIFTAYHPWGYGTRVHEIEMREDGSYSARMSRSNSCD